MSIYEYNKEFEEKKLRKAEFEYGQHELLKTQIQKNLPKENLSMKLRTLLKKVLSSFRNLSMNWNMKRHIRNWTYKKPAGTGKNPLFPVPTGPTGSYSSSASSPNSVFSNSWMEMCLLFGFAYTKVLSTFSR